MVPTRNQRTIAAPAVVEGIGYWSGEDVRVEFRPAAAGSGVVFVRGDLPHQPRIAALLDPNCGVRRTETPWRTTLQCNGVGVDMIEHVMAALAGLQIDNCEVRVDRQEMPGCDGSSMPLVEALDAAGIVEQQKLRRQTIIRRTIRLGDETSWIEAQSLEDQSLEDQSLEDQSLEEGPCCSGKTILQYELDYGGDNPIGRQALEITLSPEVFRQELAPSRTFVMKHQAEAFQARGLGRRTTLQDLLVFGPHGPIDNQLRFPDECVRHKLLDMVGDLALAGCDLVGRFVAYRSGHRLNAEMVRAVLAEEGVQNRCKRCA